MKQERDSLRKEVETLKAEGHEQAEELEWITRELATVQKEANDARCREWLEGTQGRSTVLAKPNTPPSVAAPEKEGLGSAEAEEGEEIEEEDGEMGEAELQRAEDLRHGKPLEKEEKASAAAAAAAAASGRNAGGGGTVGYTGGTSPAVLEAAIQRLKEQVAEAQAEAAAKGAEAEQRAVELRGAQEAAEGLRGEAEEARAEARGLREQLEAAGEGAAEAEAARAQEEAQLKASLQEVPGIPRLLEP